MRYSTEQARDQMLTTLDGHGWDVEHREYDPAAGDSPPGDTIHGRYDGDSDHPWMVIIPDGYYRNLRQMFTRFCETATEWVIIETSTDGEFTGFVSMSNGLRDEWELTDWVATNESDLHAEQPEKDDYTTHGNWHSVYAKWQSQCETAFRTTMATQADIRLQPQQNVTAKSVH